MTVVDGSTYRVIWDKNMADYIPGYSRTRIQSGLAMADLDNDGKIELVVATGGADPVDGNGPGALIVLTYDAMVSDERHAATPLRIERPLAEARRADRRMEMIAKMTARLLAQGKREALHAYWAGLVTGWRTGRATTSRTTAGG